LLGRSRKEGEVLRYRRKVRALLGKVLERMGLAAYRRQIRFAGNSDA
jgi:hypothetical protein